MRKLFLIIFFALFSFTSCGSDDNISSNSSNNNGSQSSDCGYYNGKRLYKGERGGCYYYNSNGNKTYVDRSYCNC